METLIPTGVCACGCGTATPIRVIRRGRGKGRAGEPCFFIRGHSTRGSLNHQWNGGRTLTAFGYIRALRPGLADHVRETMDGATHDEPRTAPLDRSVRVVLEARLRRTLTPTERANLAAETFRVIAARRRPVSAVVAELEAGKRRMVFTT